MCLRKLSHSHRAIACRPLRGFKHQGCVINSPEEAPAGSAAPGIEEKMTKAQLLPVFEIQPYLAPHIRKSIAKQAP
ncbi:hypothetical protein FH5T_07330 [Draconibacterium orientale]|uniref:Uncharacterized protein n=1 Tax=Draconibacterium orientale TaxID=1168034 RepID=A0ABM5QDH7_9BACT|nr:hypothetical protein FH5T_07330 [Draconibacterium orientale]